MTVFLVMSCTHLSYAYGYLSLLKEDHSHLSDDEIDEMLSSMDRGTQRLIRLVEDLMLLICIESGAVNIEMQRHQVQEDLNILVSEVVASHSVKAEARHVQISVNVPYSRKFFACPDTCKMC
jgi:K+-sensing histidine kinase KdpD